MKLVLLLEKDDRIQSGDFLLPASTHDAPVPVDTADGLIGEIPNGRAYREPTADDCIKNLSFADLANAVARRNFKLGLAGSIDPWKAKENGPSFYKKETIRLIIDAVEREGWDVIYNRICDLDPMSFDQPQLFTGQSVNL